MKSENRILDFSLDTIKMFWFHGCKNQRIQLSSTQYDFFGTYFTG